MIDPVAEATRLVDSLGAEQLEKAAAYTRGNEVLLVIGLGVTLLVAWLIVRSRVLDRVAGKVLGRKRFLATFAVCFTFFIVEALITLPWTIWTDWSRERSYGLSDQPLGDFLSQMALSTAIGAVLGSLFLVGVYALIRRAGKRWWAWGGAFAGVVAVIMLLAGPPLIEPLFNTYIPVPAGPVRASLEQIADDVGIPHDRIFLYDGSRQSDRFTANVSGIGPAARIAISDVAMKSASLDEVRAVTGHEAGHYQLGHIWRQVILLPLLAVLVLFAIDRLFPRVAAAMGSRATLGDPVGLPVFMVLAAIAGFLANPVLNAFSRAAETEADAYSMEHVGLPDAMASALLKTAEYRYPRPHPIEEALFYTHPSVERRVLRAMEWKAQHQSGQPAAAR
ncbi:STE24 endopeptidase [Novosphingobium hassiacum]|uniref:STE24 endopeptidase n=1 Tax=Novosphingobium hassiacum TaxID=173676 RepID=A0A7W6EV24_9SPHN|nr:M48 family metallopeptidase [Novosphingobium hassiacum]MBB3859726.1 STE24 endopeptidase [Novosphingobium hassiacum]